MGSTNKTAHYELPQFVANDKPSWLGDINQAMEDIDTGIYGAKSSADGAQQTANNAVAGVASAGTRMDGIQTQLDTVATQANQTATTVTQHTSSIATNSANINTINSRLGSTDISSIGDGTVTGAIEAIAQGGGGGSTEPQLIATAEANTTWQAQLTALQSAWAGLSADQKNRAYLLRGNGAIYKLANVTEGKFVLVSCTTANGWIDTADIPNADLVECLLTTSGVSISNIKNNVDAKTLALYA